MSRVAGMVFAYVSRTVSRIARMVFAYVSRTMLKVAGMVITNERQLAYMSRTRMMEDASLIC